MAGVRCLRVPRQPLMPPWDLLVVYHTLTGPPFETLEEVGIKFD